MENVKSKVKFNLIDFFIIVIVLGCIMGIVIRYNLVDKIGLSSAKDEAEISFIIENIRLTSADAMNEGDVFFWKQNDMEVGTLISKDVAAAIVYIIDEENMVVNKTTNDIRYDVKGVLSAKGKMTPDGFMLKGTQYVGAGKEMVLKSRNITVTVTVTGVSSVTNQP